MTSEFEIQLLVMEKYTYIGVILMLYYYCCETFPTFTNEIWQHMEIPHWVYNRRSLSKDLLLYNPFQNYY